MKKYIGIVLLLSVIVLAGCFSNSEKKPQELANKLSGTIGDFLEKTIEEHEKCDRGEINQKMFVSYTLLSTGISFEGNVEYYLVTSGEGMYIDNRGNVSSSCGFGSIPTTIEIATSETGFSLVNYQIAKDGNLYVSSTKEMFSAEAFKKRKKGDFTYNTELSPLQRAEEYFGIPFFTGGNFDCIFCDQKRYNSGYLLAPKDTIQEDYEIFTTLPQEDKYYIVFYSNGTFENHGSRDQGTGKRIFGKNDTSILVDAYPPHTYDRYILQYLSRDTMHLTREILQK